MDKTVLNLALNHAVIPVEQPFINQDNSQSQSHRSVESGDTKNSSGPDWWYRLDSDLTPNVKTHDVAHGMGNYAPANRRRASAASLKYYVILNKEDDKDDAIDNSNCYYTLEQDDPQMHLNCTAIKKKIQNEYMIISGGYTDKDWVTFPVWAYDATAGKQAAKIRNRNRSGENNRDMDPIDQDTFTDIDVHAPPWVYNNAGWVDLSGHQMGLHAEVNQTEMEAHFNFYPDENDNDQVIWPQGRTGHVSSVYDGYLFVIGGLLWKNDEFVTEDNAYVWRALVSDIMEHVQFNKKNKSAETPLTKGLLWERIQPNIFHFHEFNSPKSSMPWYSPGYYDPISKSENKSRNSSFLRSSTSSEEEPSFKGNTEHDIFAFSRGEAQGGHWGGLSVAGHDRGLLILYGGLRNAQSDERLVETVFGDVWSYDYESNTLRQLASYPPAKWQWDTSNANRDRHFPTARTAHAASIAGNVLLIHGGLSPSKLPGEPWKGLSDVWEFDLIRRVWKERKVSPQLERAYHSLQGADDGSAVAFGGVERGKTITGEQISYVFEDTLVTTPNYPLRNITNSTWRKAQWPTADLFEHNEAVSNRLEHSSILDKDGTLLVWGGLFETVAELSGVWAIDVFNTDSAVQFEVFEMEGLEAYKAELEALNLLVVAMFFVSVLFSAMFGILRRQAQEATNGGGDGGGGGSTGTGGVFWRRGGLSQENIDRLPVNTYTVEESSLEGEASMTTTTTGVSSSLEEEEELCPICLVGYENGDSFRTLPCKHYFHVNCVDAWFEAHDECPVCRHSLAGGAVELPNSTTASSSIPDASNGVQSEEVGEGMGGWRRATLHTTHRMPFRIPRTFLPSSWRFGRLGQVNSDGEDESGEESDDIPIVHDEQSQSFRLRSVLHAVWGLRREEPVTEMVTLNSSHRANEGETTSSLMTEIV